MLLKPSLLVRAEAFYVAADTNFGDMLVELLAAALSEGDAA